MTGADIAVMATVMGVYGLFSRRLATTVISLAMVMVGFGYLMGPDGLNLFTAQVDESVLRLAAEATLALVLFSDASRISTNRLRHEAAVPLRLLGIGLPLTIALGALAALVLFDSLDASQAIVLAVCLAPTDAALGLAVVSDTRLPSTVRQGLNVESGLNDGICVPLLFVALAADEASSEGSTIGRVASDLLKEIGAATIAGGVVALVTVLLLRWSLRHGWIEDAWRQVVPLTTAVAAYGLALELGGSAFIAAFVAGLAFGFLVERFGLDGVHGQLLEEVGGLFDAATFFLFGAVALWVLLDGVTWQVLVYALLSLTVVRMIPVAVALLGSGLQRPTRLFIGWFGPRGLASIVFALVVVEESQLPGTELIVQVSAVTILFSVVAHGISAVPLTNRYVSWFRSLPSTSSAAELAEVTVPAARHASRHVWAVAPPQGDGRVSPGTIDEGER